MFFIWKSRIALMVSVAELLMLPIVATDAFVTITVFEASDSVLYRMMYGAEVLLVSCIWPRYSAGHHPDVDAAAHAQVVRLAEDGGEVVWVSLPSAATVDVGVNVAGSPMPLVCGSQLSL